jgi:3-oxoacyl-[acyl-carrier protein] reductase
VEWLGRLDIVVVNAGILRLGDVQAVSLQDLDLMLQINVRGVFLAIQAAAPHLSEGGRDGGPERLSRIERLFDDQGGGGRHGEGNRGRPCPRGITVNNIQPGPTRTDMTAEHIDGLTPMIPLKRVGDPDEIAGLVAYLAGRESGYMTGASLTIDGGLALCISDEAVARLE